MSMRGKRWILGGLLAATVASAVPAAGRLGGVAGALSGKGVHVEDVLHQDFLDLDRDGVKEILVHAEGRWEKPLPAGCLVIPLGVPGTPPDANPEAVLLPSAPRGDRFVGVFRFERSSFHWSPVLFGSYSRDQGRVVSFRALDVEGEKLVRLSFLRENRIQDHLFRLMRESVESVFRFQRGTEVGEGFWPRGGKLLTARGLPDPFNPGRGRPGFLARIRYRWNSGRFEPEHWVLTGYGFRGDLPLPEVPAWSSVDVERIDAARTCWDIQRAADRGTGTERFDLKEFCHSRHGAGSYRVVYESDGYGVAVQTATGRPEARYFFRPFHRSRHGGRSVWVALREL